MNVRTFLGCGVLLVSIVIGAAPARASVPADTVYVVVDTPPEPEGGLAAMMARVRFPESMVDGPDARLIFQVVVDETGTVRDVEALRDGPEAYRIEAERVIAETRFVPARRDGEAVAAYLTLPFHFVVPPEWVLVYEPNPRTPDPILTRSGSPRNVVPPRMIGGMEGLERRLRYPANARYDGAHGTIVVSFFVNEDGAPEEITCLPEQSYGLCREGIRVVRESSFEPAKIDGQPVRMHFELSIDFRFR